MAQKTLVLAEKPSVGRDIAKVLKCNKKIGNSALEGNQYIITWAMGHLVELAPPERYNEKYKEWKLDTLPMIPEKWKLEVIPKTGKQFQSIKTQLNRADVKDIVIATDAGREGELVARWILLKVGTKKPIKRLWISSVTDKAIKEGFQKLKNGKDYEGLFQAAQNRAKADWVVGMNATRALTCKYNAQLSCGRVQTPTLAMIAKKGEEIRKFTPKPYYGGSITVDGTKFIWNSKQSNSSQTFDREKAIQIIQITKENQNKAIVHKVEKTNKTTPPPQLFDLTQLQKEANQKFDYSAKETLNIMQRLYENHKVLTYPRTDSKYLTQDIIPTIKERIDACATGPYRALAPMAKKKPLTGKLAFVNDAKVTDHHAIIPTETYVQLEHMSVEERKIYDLVVRRFLAVLYPTHTYEQTAITIDVAGEYFKATANVVTNVGWKQIYEKEQNQDNVISKTWSRGEKVQPTSINLTEGKTAPPAHFNEGTLLAAMENPVHYMESNKKEDAQVLGETGGLGTVATRADIIDKLFNSFLIEKRNNKEIHITAKGKQLLELVPQDLQQPDLTANWERQLSNIATGKLKGDNFYKQVCQYSKDLVTEIKQGQGNFKHENITRDKCPDCGKFMLLVKGKTATMKVCQDRECGHRESVSRTSNARCPKCHKKLELWGKGESQQFICGKCGHKEKLASFTQRRKKEGAGVSKKDVQKYLNKQNKEEDVANTSLGDLFKNITL